MGSGTYIVKSGYRLLIRGQSHLQQALANPMTLSTKNFFSDLWPLQLPEKIKIIMWKFYKKFVPTYSNLNKRHISPPTLCPLCHTDLETIDHLLRFCPIICQIWNSLHLFVPPTSKHPKYMTWLVDFFQVADERSKKLMTLSIMAILFARNKLNHEGLRQTVQEMVVFILGYLAEIESLDSAKNPNHAPSQSRWRPPNQGLIKINFDLAFNFHEKTSILGVIARNEDGLIMGACTYLHFNIVDAFVAEAWACKQPIRFAQEIDFRSV